MKFTDDAQSGGAMNSSGGSEAPEGRKHTEETARASCKERQRPGHLACRGEGGLCSFCESGHAGNSGHPDEVDGGERPSPGWHLGTAGVVGLPVPHFSFSGASPGT